MNIGASKHRDLITLSNLRNIIFGLLEILIHQCKVPDHLDVIIMSNFPLSIVSNSISTRDTQVFDTSQQISVCYHVSKEKLYYYTYQALTCRFLSIQYYILITYNIFDFTSTQSCCWLSWFQSKDDKGMLHQHCCTS